MTAMGWPGDEESPRMSAHDREPDDLELFIREQCAMNPLFRAHMDDAGRRMDLPEELRSARERAGLTQAKVADALGIKQPTVSEFESGMGDFYLSTAMGYARAIGGRIEIRFVRDETSVTRP